MITNALTDKPWDELAGRFNPKVGEIDPDVADNVLMAWPAMVAEINSNCKSTDAPLLDFGCGTGGLANLLAQQGYIVDALDPSSGMIKTARMIHAFDGLNFIDGDHSLLTKPSNYQGIVSCMVLQFIKNIDEVAVALSKSLQVGGIFCFTIFSPAYFESNFGPTKVFGNEGTGTVIRFDNCSVPIFIRSCDQYVEIFERAGFSLTNSELIPFTQEFLDLYWDQSSGIDVLHPKFEMMTLKKGS